MPVEDNKDALVSVKGHLNYGPPPECSETEDCYHFLREGVLEKLLHAEQSLPSGFRFRLYEGYRSPEFQDTLFHQQLQRVVLNDPTLSPKDAYSIAAQLVAPTRTYEGLPLFPPRSSGGAVDIEIVDSNGQVIDFGMEIKDWVSVCPSLCETQALGLSPEAVKNRTMLVSVMSEAGFVNYSREWWHFSYGDQYWAYFTGHPYAYYGSVGLARA